MDEADDDLKVLIRNATAKWRTAGRTSGDRAGPSKATGRARENTEAVKRNEQRNALTDDVKGET